MILKVLGSSSKGNCYLLMAQDDILILEAGVVIKDIKMALGFDFRNVRGCLVTHEHKDHSRAAIDLHNMGIPIYCTKGTREALELPHKASCIMVPEVTTVKIGGFAVTAYKSKHDAAEPCMFLIYHPEMGSMAFATDTYIIPYDFRGLNHYLIEANYSMKIIQDKVTQGLLNMKLAQRIIKSHLSLENALKQIKDSNDLENVILIHLSDSNSNAEEFKAEAQKSTGKPVYIADKGLNVELRRREE